MLSFLCISETLLINKVHRINPVVNADKSRINIVEILFLELSIFRSFFDKYIKKIEILMSLRQPQMYLYFDRNLDMFDRSRM